VSRLLPRLVAVAAAALLVIGAGIWVLAYRLPPVLSGYSGRYPLTPAADDPSAHRYTSLLGGWPGTAPGQALLGSAGVLLGLAWLVGASCRLVAGRAGGATCPDQRTRRTLGGTLGPAVVLLALGALLIAVAPAVHGGLVYMSPEEFEALVRGDRWKRTGQVLVVVGALAGAGAAGWSRGRRGARATAPAGELGDVPGWTVC